MGKRAPDVVLADVMMPGLDGLGLVRAIRSAPALTGVPVILLSARAEEAAKIEAFEAGADDYLVKPFNARESVARVGSSLASAKLRKQTTAELDGMKRLQEVANLCVRSGNHFEKCLDEIIAAAIAVTGADKGNIQLLEPQSQCLKIAAQRGFEEPFLKFFAEVTTEEASVCGRALRSSERVVVEDVMQRKFSWEQIHLMFS
jgi:CheY-like chemotaxis protein